MDRRYRINDTSQILSPALVIFREVLEENLRCMIAIAGHAGRLRPHCKTHKIREVAELELRLGITRHKCATFAEAEMLALAGVRDVFLAYNLVGPNIPRAVEFRRRFPDVSLMVTADHEGPLAELGRAMASAGLTIGVLLDLDTGQHRTGVPIGSRAEELYGRIAATPGIEPAGFHLYDGQNHQTDLAERTLAVDACWVPVTALRDRFTSKGWPVPRIVAGGTGSFPIFAQKEDPSLELSPGTCVFHDAGYDAMFPDLRFSPAALVLTRVISRPTADRVTFDLGYKAVASDPPAGRRLSFPDLPDAQEVLQNEEHLVVTTRREPPLQPGDEQLVVPRHICPTSALHKQAYVVADGDVVARWDVVARDRWLSV